MCICIASRREHTSKALRYGTHSHGISQFYLHTPRSSANGMNHTCLFLPSRSWYSFTDPRGMEGWVGLYDPAGMHGNVNLFLKILNNTWEWCCKENCLSVIAFILSYAKHHAHHKSCVVFCEVNKLILPFVIVPTFTLQLMATSTIHCWLPSIRSWSGIPCRTTSSHSRTMSHLDRAWKPGLSLDTSVFSALET